MNRTNSLAGWLRHTLPRGRLRLLSAVLSAGTLQVEDESDNPSSCVAEPSGQGGLLAREQPGPFDPAGRDAATIDACFFTDRIRASPPENRMQGCLSFLAFFLLAIAAEGAPPRFK